MHYGKKPRLSNCLFISDHQLLYLYVQKAWHICAVLPIWLLRIWLSWDKCNDKGSPNWRWFCSLLGGADRWIGELINSLIAWILPFQLGCHINDSRRSSLQFDKTFNYDYPDKISDATEVTSLNKIRRFNYKLRSQYMRLRSLHLKPNRPGVSFLNSRTKHSSIQDSFKLQWRVTEA